jgi:hypothetical protein
MGLTAMGIGIFVGEVVAALVAVGMTPIAFPGLCDGRCQRAGLLAALQVIGAAATLGAWWWVPSMAWLAWAVSLLAQGVLITAQWRNVHLAARNRVASLVSSFVRRLVPASVMALLAGVAVGPPDGSTTPRVDT